MGVSFINRLMIYVVGLLTMSYGISLTIQVKHLGVAAWDVLNLGLVNTFGLTIGTWGLIVGLVIVGVVFMINRTYLSYGTIGNILFIGPMIDVYLRHPILASNHSFVMDWMIFLIGVTLCGVGSGIYITAKLGTGPRDALMLIIKDKTGWDVAKVRFGIEISVFIIGAVMGGSIFIGTVIFSFLVSNVFKVSNHYCTKWVQAMSKKKEISLGKLL